METSQTIEKTMLLLQTLAEQKRCSASVITNTLEVHRSTSYRMLKSLVQLGYVNHFETTGKYSLSLKMEDLIHTGTSWSWLKEIAEPHMDKLYRQINETIHLAVLQKNELSYLSKWESTRSLRVVVPSKEGGHAPLHCTGLGKMLLSCKENESREVLIRKMKLTRYTEHTICTLAAFRSELQKIQESRVSYDMEEHEEGVCCISVPLTGKEQRVIAAISITVPHVRFTQTRKNDLK
ncbi:MAG: hypothetical protein B6241_11800 [Spirochaetaceae bacterium 4572_59]|nr:MAG: hypothetical protein B6241_11800 [Spirochaetaceae bacterium 4572_59]